MRRSSQETRGSRFSRDIVPKHVCQVAEQRSRRCTDIHNEELHTSLHSLFRPAQSTDRSERRQLSGGVPRGRVRESRCYLFRGVPTERLVQTHPPLETFGNDTEACAHRSQSAFPDDDDWQMTVPPPRHSRPGPPSADFVAQIAPVVASNAQQLPFILHTPSATTAPGSGA